eukprot:12922208-Prorocentrum_lima.AAC.1
MQRLRGSFRGSGWAVADGSCTGEVAGDLRRAGWGVVALDDAGREVARLHGAVPAPLPQNAYLAEWMA